MTLSIHNVLCSIQRALLNYVTPNLRAVNVECKDDFISLHLYYNDPLLTYEEEFPDFIDVEFFADFPAIENEFKVIILPYPNPIPHFGHRVYQRHEPSIK